MSEMYTISEIADFFNVSSQTLRYYDRIGLMKPDIVDPKTGYRYYSEEQMDSLYLIKSLKSMGLTLEDIRNYITKGAFEDHATNAVLVMEKTKKILEKLRYILAIEMIQAAQAVDLRKLNTMGESTAALYRKLRGQIPFLDADRCHSKDFQTVYEMIQNGIFDECLK